MQDVMALVVLGVASLLPIMVFGAIFRKAGYSAWLGLLMVVPVVNLIWLIVFAASEWPIHRELARLRAGGGEASGEDTAGMLSQAARFEQQGDWDEAISIYDRIAALPDDPNAAYAANCAERLRVRLTGHAG